MTVPKSKETSAVYMQQDTCNNNNMRNPRCRGGYACYYCCMPSSPVLLHVYCPHPLSCCIYAAFIPCLAAYILHLFLYFLALSSLHFNGNVFTLLYHWFSLYRNSRMPYLLCVYKAYNSRSSALLVLWVCRRNPYIYAGYIRESSRIYDLLYQRVE